LKSIIFRREFLQLTNFTLLISSVAASDPINQPFSITCNDQSDNETGFSIEYRDVSDMEWTISDSVPSAQNSYGPVRFYGNDTYLIRMHAFNGNGNSKYSNTLTVFVGESLESVGLQWPALKTDCIPTFFGIIFHDRQILPITASYSLQNLIVLSY
jgi:hypothetical protein